MSAAPFSGPADPELSLLRIVAQRLAGPKLKEPADVVRWLGCMQAQHLPGALHSVALRCGPQRASIVGTEVTPSAPPRSAAAGPVPKAPRAADMLNDATVVRTWPMRGTLHLCPAQDVGWMTSLTRDALWRRSAARRAQLGVDEAMLERAWQIVFPVLSEVGRLSRAQLLELWAPYGLTEVPQRGFHLIVALAQNGLLCQGPLSRRPDGSSSDSEQDFVACADWIASPRVLAPDQAIASWLRTFVLSHGPVTVKDAQRWTGLTTGQVRMGLAAIDDELATCSLAPGTPSASTGRATYYYDPALPDLLAEHRAQAEGLLALPGFDELVLGYADRSCTVPVEHAQAVVPGGNGVFKPTLVHAGRAVGTWRFGAPRLHVTPFTTFTAAQRKALRSRGAEPV